MNRLRILRPWSERRILHPISRGLFIQTETTPNENALKFKPGKPVTGGGPIVEVLDRKAARRTSDLADDLLCIEGVCGVLFGSDFITISKAQEYDWALVKPAAFAAIMDHMGSGKPVLKPEAEQTEEARAEQAHEGDFEEADRETVLMIKEILDTRIRPTVQDDGGDVQFVAFRKGVVELQMRGACRSCSSSVVTLKHGIENMLMHYIPEVQEVRQVEDPADTASQAYFEKIEKEKPIGPDQ